MGSYLTPANMSAAGTGASALGSIMQGVAASRSDKFNAEVDAQNAVIAKQEAAWTGAVGESDVGIQGLKTRQTVGNIKAEQAGNGVDVNTGSAVDVRKSAAEEGMQSAMNIRSSAARQAYGLEVGATSDQNNAALAKSAGKNALIAGIQGAGNDILKTTTNPNSALYAGSTAGGPTGGDSAANATDVASMSSDEIGVNNGVLSGQTSYAPTLTNSLFGY